MTYFAEIDSITKKVKRVIVAEQYFIDSGNVGDPKNWIQTSYNFNIREKYAGINDIYDEINDRFQPIKPSEDCTWNEKTKSWDYPMDKPLDSQLYRWSEKTKSWELNLFQ